MSIESLCLFLSIVFPSRCETGITAESLMIEEVSSERTVLHFCGNGAILKEQDVLLSTNGDGLHPVGQWVEGEATQC